MEGVSVGFLENIVGVNFASGNWVGIHIVPEIHTDLGSVNNHMIEFPDIEQGTPGLPIIISNFAPSSCVAAFKSNTDTPGVPKASITAKQLKQTRTSGAKRVYNTFGAKQPLTTDDHGHFGHFGDITLIFIRLDGALAKGTHRMLVRTSVVGSAGSSEPLGVGLFEAKSLKAGVALQYLVGGGEFSMSPFFFSGVRSFINAAYTGSDVQTFLINSKDLTAVWL